MKTLPLIFISASSTTFAQFGNSRSGAGMTNQQQELLRRRRRTTTPPTEYPTDPLFFNEEELLLNGGYDGIYVKNRIRRTIPGSLRSMTDADLDLIDRSAVTLQADQEIEVHEGLAQHLDILIEKSGNDVTKKNYYTNLRHAISWRIENNNTHVSKAAMDWYLGSVGRSHCERGIDDAGVDRNFELDSENPNFNRNFRSTCETLLPLDLNYGCWCHASSDDVFKGTGDYVDEFDKACKMMKQCLRCVRHDSRETNQVCDPSTQRYYLTQQFTSRGVLQECETANEGDYCAIHTCCCEIEFTRNILDVFMNQEILLNNDLHHEHGFIVEDNCVGSGVVGQATDCCGEYPNRRMYALEKMTCCNGKTLFNPLNKVCCDDGSVAPTNDLCGLRKRRKRNV